MFMIRKTRHIALLVTLSVVMMLGMMWTRARLMQTPCCVEGRKCAFSEGRESAAVVAAEHVQILAVISLNVLPTPATQTSATHAAPATRAPGIPILALAPKTSPPAA